MPSISLKTQTILSSPKALSHQLKHLGLTDKQWVRLAKEFENNPGFVTIEDGKIQTLDRKIVIEKKDLIRKPFFGSGLVAFFLKAMQGKKYRQRMDNLAIGFLDLIQKSQSSQLTQVSNKVEEIVFPEPAIVVKPVKVRKPEPIVVKPVEARRPEPIFVRPVIERENAREAEKLKRAEASREELRSEKQALSKLASEGSVLLISNKYEIQELSRSLARLEGQKLENGFDLNLFLKCRDEVNGAEHTFEKLQKDVDESKRNKYPEPSIEQIKRERKDLDASIKKFKEAVQALPQTKIRLNQVSQKLTAVKADAENKKNAAEQALRKEKQELSALSNEASLLLINYKAQIQALRQSSVNLEPHRFEDGFDLTSFWNYKSDADQIRRCEEKLQNEAKYPVRRDLEDSIKNFKEATRKIVQTQNGFDQIRQKLESVKAAKGQAETAEKALRKERQTLASVLSEGNSLLSSQLLEIPNLRDSFKKVDREMSLIDRLSFSNTLDSANNALQELQRTVNVAKSHLSSEAAVKSARRNLESSIRELKASLPHLPGISRAIQTAQRNILNKKQEEDRRKQEQERQMQAERQAREQAERQARQRQVQAEQDRRAQEAQRARVEQLKVEQLRRELAAAQAASVRPVQVQQVVVPQANAPVVAQDIFADDDSDDILVASTGFGGLGIPYTQNLLDLIKLGNTELKYKGPASNTIKVLTDVLKTIGFETVKDCKDKGIKDFHTFQAHIENNKEAFKRAILQKHGNVIKEEQLMR